MIAVRCGVRRAFSAGIMLTSPHRRMPGQHAGEFCGGSDAERAGLNHLLVVVQFRRTPLSELLSLPSPVHADPQACRQPYVTQITTIVKWADRRKRAISTWPAARWLSPTRTSRCSHRPMSGRGDHQDGPRRLLPSQWPIWLRGVADGSRAVQWRHHRRGGVPEVAPQKRAGEWVDVAELRYAWHFAEVIHDAVY